MEGTTQKIQIDIFKIWEILKNDKKTIIKYCFIGALIGVIIAFSTPKIYKSNVMLAPESSINSMTSNLSTLASMVGMDMGFGSNIDAIYPEIYPDVLLSTKFLVGLFNIPIVTKDGEIKTTLYNYIKNEQKEPWWMYPFKLTGKFISLFQKKDETTGNLNPTMLSKEDYKITQNISKSINCQVDKKTNVISITVTSQDALVSKIIADSVKSKLQDFITDYRTNKARNDLAYMEKLCKEAEEDYSRARLRYAAYCDNSLNLVLESHKVKVKELEYEMQLRYTIYTQIVQQLQICKAKVQERTPAFTEIQPAIVPIKHGNTPKIVTLALFCFLSFFVRLLILFWEKRKLLFVE